MIDEKKLIGRLEEHSFSLVINWEKGKYLQKDKAIEIVNELAEEHKGGWIPVSERLPEDDEDVLVWFEYFKYGEYNGLYQRIGISHTFKGDWSGFVNGHSGWQQLKVIAWQPLPEPYQQEEEKDSTPYGINAEKAGEALKKLSEAIRKATTADSIELEKRNIEQNPSINFFQKRKLIKQLDEMKGEL